MTQNSKLSVKEAHVSEELSIDELQSSLLIHEGKICQQEKEEHTLKASTNNSFAFRVGPGRENNRGRSKGNNGCGYQNHYQGGRRGYHDYHQGGGIGGGIGYQNYHHQGRGRGSHHSTSFRTKLANK